MACFSPGFMCIAASVYRLEQNAILITGYPVKSEAPEIANDRLKFPFVRLLFI
jgi:hypothetical protein